MNVLTMIGFFGAFGLGGAIAAALVPSRLPTALLLAVTPLLVAGNYVLMMAAPFPGVPIEFLLIATSGLAVSCPMAVFFRLGELYRKRLPEGAPPGAQPKRPLTLVQAVALGIFLPTVALTLSTLVSRLNEASWLRWECDGKIVQVTRNKSNHNNPVLAVETNGLTENFEMVDATLWGEAKVGGHLKKSAGSPMAWLDGRLVRMVPRQVGWWNEPR